VLRADMKPIVDGEAAHRAASPSISVLTYLRIAISQHSQITGQAGIRKSNFR